MLQTTVKLQVIKDDNIYVILTFMSVKEHWVIL